RAGIALDDEVHLELARGQVHELRTDPRPAPAAPPCGVHASDEPRGGLHEVPRPALAQLVEREAAEVEARAQEERGAAGRDLRQVARVEALPALVLLAPGRGRGRRADLHVAVDGDGEVDAEEGEPRVRHGIDVRAEETLGLV